MAQLVLPAVAAVVGTIPLAGPPIQATIGGLLAILQGIDRNSQNRKELAKLESRLHRLHKHLCTAPTAGDPGEQSLRDFLITVLRETSAELVNLGDRGIGSSSRVTQVIIGCSNNVNDYLLEFSVMSHMQLQYRVDEILTTVQCIQSADTGTLRVPMTAT